MSKKESIIGRAKSTPYCPFVFDLNCEWEKDVLAELISHFSGQMVKVTIETIEE